MSTLSSYTQRAGLANVIEQLRQAIQTRAAEGLVDNTPVLSPARPTPLERDDDDGKNCEMQESCDWPPEVVDGRLHQLTNGRWLRAWRRTGESEIRPPMIDEIDQAGVDRHLIARVVSPETLTQIEQEVRRERVQLCAEQVTNPGIMVFSFQHLLLQRLQEIVLKGELRASPTQPGQWQVGDTVMYCGEVYTIVSLSDRTLTLESDYAGSLDLTVSGLEITRLRRVQRDQ